MRYAFTILLLSVLLYAHREVERENSFYQAQHLVHVTAPPTKPQVTQHSIDVALALYSIKAPHDVSHPMLDLQLKDRGLTKRSLALRQSIVTIGPAAFESWALLGSTLSHEIEIHCRQNMIVIVVKDLFFGTGIRDAEREAYIYEIKNAKRFGLIKDDVDTIKQTMDYYYSKEL